MLSVDHFPMILHCLLLLLLLISFLLPVFLCPLPPPPPPFILPDLCPPQCPSCTVSSVACPFHPCALSWSATQPLPVTGGNQAGLTPDFMVPCLHLLLLLCTDYYFLAPGLRQLDQLQQNVSRLPSGSELTSCKICHSQYLCCCVYTAHLWVY